jgi:PAS domain S-box-containing protein
MDNPAKDQRATGVPGLWSMPGKLAWIYAGAAGLWILTSDGLVDRWLTAPEVHRWASTTKGFCFVIATAVLLYFLLRRWAMRVQNVHQELLRAESAFRTVVEAAPDAIFIESGGRYVFANTGVCRLLGVRDASEVIGQEVLRHVVPQLREQVRSRMEQLVREGKALDPIQGRILRADGTEVPVEVTAVPMDYQGAPAALVMARNISRRLAEEAVRRQEQELLQAVLRSASDAIFAKDLACRYLLINESGARVLGQPIDRILGRTNHDVLAPSIAATLEASDRQVLQTGQRCEFDLPLMVGGQRRHFFVRKEPIRDEAGRLTGMLGVARDMTRQVEAEESLRRLSGRFLRLQDEERRSIARELHDTTAQGLVAISLGLSEALRSAKDGDRGWIEALEECRVLVEGCTRDVRTLSYGLHPPMLDEMGLPAALEEYVKELGKRSGLKLECVCSRDLGRLGQDAEMALFRVAQEALLNVNRHSGSATAQVMLRSIGGSIELEVKDDGKGIPPERLDQLRRGTSVGVGISGMRERLRQLGGELDVMSDGSGTVVLARLPGGSGQEASISLMGTEHVVSWNRTQ